MASRQIFILKALNQLEDNMSDWVMGPPYDASVQRLLHRAFPGEPDSPARHKYPDDFKTDFVRSRIFLTAAAGQGDSFEILGQINAPDSQWLLENYTFCSKYPKMAAYDFLCGFFLEQSHDKLEHPIVVGFLDSFMTVVPVLLEYYNFLMMSGECDPWLSVSQLNGWHKAPNLYRLYALIEVVKDLTSETEDFPLPWADVLCETRPVEFASALLKASFEKRMVEAILSASEVTQEVECQPEAQDETELLTETEEEISQDCNAEADYLRSRRDKELKIKAWRKWEVAALKCEGLKHLEVHKLVFLEREQDDARKLRALPEKAKAKHSKKIADNNECYIAKEIGKVRKILEVENQPIPKALQPYRK